MGAPEPQVAAQENLSITLHMDEAMQANLRRNVGVVAEAESCMVDSAEMAQVANAEMRGVIERRKILEKERKGFLEPASQIIERARALFNPALAALTRAEEIYKDKLLTFQKEERRQADEARRTAEDAARKARQEAEQQAAAARARAEEQAREARRKEQEAQEAQRKALAEGNARAAAAAAAEAAKQAEKAQAAVENGEARAAVAQLSASTVVTAPPAQAPTQIAGFGSRGAWVAEVEVDEPTTIRAIAAALATRPELVGLLKLDTRAAGQMARALHGNTNIPGMKVREEQVAVSRKG